MISINKFLIYSACAVLLLSAAGTDAEETSLKSEIISVKLYQNQAQITRQAKISLRKGANSVVLGMLPDLLYDWSAKAGLPEGYNGKILSLEVERKALVKKRQKRIFDIEQKLDELKQQDQVYADELKNIKSQEQFLNSVLDFTNREVSKELETRIPQISVWDSTLKYVSVKNSDLLKHKREIEKKREDLGKEIRKWEFELSQIAGNNYFSNYQTLSNAIIKNKESMNVQQFADLTGKYAEQSRLLEAPPDNVDIEKQFIADIYSSQDSETTLTFSYVIPDTSWQMQYDIRAGSEKKEIDMIIYANIYQKTEEDWTNVLLSISTGSPVNAIQPPSLQPWYLDIYTPQLPTAESSNRKSAMKKDEEMYAEAVSEEEDKTIPQISEKGPYFEITMPVKQTILSSAKYQKKFINEYSLKDKENVEFYYELTPAEFNNSFLKVKTKNTTNLPWLSGESQIFLEKEFMGKVNIPFTPPGKEEDFVLGIESRITGKKELVRKYEDTAGVFGGKRRILYSYKLTLGNQLKSDAEIIIQDAIPVSRNEKINISLEKLSHPFIEDERFLKSTEFVQGIRKWKLSIPPHKEKEITYDIVISFDKDVEIEGLR